MKNTNTEKYRIILEQEKEKLEKEIAEDEKGVDFGSDIEGGDEESDEVEERGNRIAVANELKKRLQEIEGALKRIKSGSYGKCLNCEGEISENILDLIPESELCQECKLKTSK